MLRIHTSKWLYLAFCFIAFNACYNPSSKCKESLYDEDKKVYGWKPKFTDINIFKVISFTTPQPTEKAGKIYLYNNYLLQVESGQGIHIIDVTDKKNPAKVGFINCKGAEEIEMKDGYLITNNLNDLVTLQFNFTTKALVEVKRLTNALTLMDKNYRTFLPPDTGYFECEYYGINVIESWYKDSIFLYRSCYNSK